MPADEEDLVGAVCFFYDEYGKVAGICCLGALVIFCFAIGGDDGGLVSVVGECESGEIGCVAVRLICAVGAGCACCCHAYAAAAQEFDGDPAVGWLAEFAEWRFFGYP